MPNRKGIVVGLLRPPNVFFFEVDSRTRETRKKLLRLCKNHLKYYSVYLTKHGYHVIGYPFRKKIWRIFKNAIKTDFTLNLRPRWNMPRYRAQVLRISPKFELKTGEEYSFSPRKMLGNFELLNIQKYKVVYYTCKCG